MKHCLLDAIQVLSHAVCGVTKKYLIGCAKHKRQCRNKLIFWSWDLCISIICNHFKHIYDKH